jgi:glycosyltransferase involved in cell wall biosynthesis
LPDKKVPRPTPQGQCLHFLYAGRLAQSHGVDVLLDSLEHLPKEGWHLTIAGHGPLTEHVIRFAREPKWQNRVRYLEPMSSVSFDQRLRESHVGLNCQRASDPISAVTFPSKIFTYLAAGLLVISSRTTNVAIVCGEACVYYETESPAHLAHTMRYVIENYAALAQQVKNTSAIQQYKIAQSAVRLRRLLAAARMLE